MIILEEQETAFLVSLSSSLSLSFRSFEEKTPFHPITPPGTRPSFSSFSSRVMSAKLFASRINCSTLLRSAGVSLTRPTRSVAAVAPSSAGASESGTVKVRDLMLEICKGGRRMFSIIPEGTVLRIGERRRGEGRKGPGVGKEDRVERTDGTYFRGEGRWRAGSPEQLFCSPPLRVLHFDVVEKAHCRAAPKDPVSVVLSRQYPSVSPLCFRNAHVLCSQGLDVAASSPLERKPGSQAAPDASASPARPAHPGPTAPPAGCPSGPACSGSVSCGLASARRLPRGCARVGVCGAAARGGSW